MKTAQLLHARKSNFSHQNARLYNVIKASPLLAVKIMLPRPTQNDERCRIRKI